MRLLYLLIFQAVVSFVFSNNAICATDLRVALVIGNSAYKASPLLNPVNDANDMAATLKNLGFQVIHKTDADHMTIEEALRDFSWQLRKGGTGLFYFAGHGVQVNGSNYLIPLKANIKKEFEVKFRAVNAGFIIESMFEAGSDINIVILDACRDNPFPKSFRSSSQGLAQVDAPAGTFIAYATSPGTVASDGKGRNGIFTKHLLDNLKLEGLQIEQVFKRTRNGVIKETNNKQVPWQSSSLTGSFYFKPKGETAMAESESELLKAKENERRRQDTLFWESVKDSPDPAAHKAYLDKFPEGTFADLAKLKIKQLRKDAVKPKVEKSLSASATLSLESNIKNANVLIDGKRVGTTPLSSLSVTPGRHSIQVEKSGFEPIQLQRDFEPNKEQSLYVHLEQIKDTKARLFIKTDPENALIKIVNVVPEFHQGISLNPGRYHVRILADGYNTNDTWVELSSGEEKHITIALQKIAAKPSEAEIVSKKYKSETATKSKKEPVIENSPKKSKITISSNVDGAKVSINGRIVGITPLLDYPIKPGKHTIRIQKDGYESYEQKHGITAGLDQSLSINLKKDTPPEAKLYVTTEPENATVKIMNIVPKFHQGIILKPGKYHVKVLLNEYQTEEKWIVLKAGEEKRVMIKLKNKEPVPPQTDIAKQGTEPSTEDNSEGRHPDSGSELQNPTGSSQEAEFSRLFIQTDPKDARVQIYNFDKDYYPGIKVAPGGYLITVSEYGYKSGQLWVSIGANKIIRKTIKLEKEKASDHGNKKVVSVRKGDTLPLTCAILPWSPKSSTYFKIIFNAIVKKIDKARNLSLSFSYYNLYRRPSILRIGSKLVGKQMLEDIWKKNTFYSKPQPAIAKIVEIGQKLNVDLVFVGRYTLKDRGAGMIMNHIKIYVIDVRESSVRTYEDNTFADLYMGDYDTIYKVVDKAISASLKYAMQ